MSIVHGTREGYNVCRIRDGKPCLSCIEAARIWAAEWFASRVAR